MKKVVIVTGANSGIGKATAALFAQKGYRVAISARRIEELNKVQKELADGAEVAAISADVSLAKDVEHLVQAVVAKWGQIDVLIHAAGVIYSGTLLETDEKTWDYILDINLKGTYLVNRSVLEQMVNQRYGSIVNIASDAGLLGGRNLAAYCAVHWWSSPADEGDRTGSHPAGCTSQRSVSWSCQYPNDCWAIRC